LNLQTPLPDFLRRRVSLCSLFGISIDAICRCPDLTAIPQIDHIHHCALFALNDSGNLARLPHAVTLSHQYTLTQSPQPV
jgi:hypothetical protein